MAIYSPDGSSLPLIQVHAAVCHLVGGDRVLSEHALDGFLRCVARPRVSSAADTKAIGAESGRISWWSWLRSVGNARYPGGNRSNYGAYDWHGKTVHHMDGHAHIPTFRQYRRASPYIHYLPPQSTDGWNLIN